jgi:hypothetical protein
LNVDVSVDVAVVVTYVVQEVDVDVVFSAETNWSSVKGIRLRVISKTNSNPSDLIIFNLLLAEELCLQLHVFYP